MTEAPILDERIRLFRSGVSMREIARRHGVSRQAVHQSLRKAGVDTARQPPPPVNPEEEAVVAAAEASWPR